MIFTISVRPRRPVELHHSVGHYPSWRDTVLDAALGALKARPADDRDERIRTLEQRLGRTVVENELQREQIARLEAGLPLVRRRSRK